VAASQQGIVKRTALSAGLALLALLGLSAALAQAEVTQQGTLRVSFDGKLSPHALPRAGTAPIAVSIGADIGTTDRTAPPQLQKITIAINRHGRLDRNGLPSCHLKRIQPSTSQDALKACRDALVGEGTFAANVALPEQAPFPSHGKVLAFNGMAKGRPVIFAHIYGTDPVPTSYTLSFRLSHSKGTFATVLSADLPQVTSDWGFVTGISMTLERRYRYHGHAHSYLSAGCPAPAGFQGAIFPFAKASLFFAGQILTSTLTRSCGVTS
jgi:hypothetical protein